MDDTTPSVDVTLGYASTLPVDTRIPFYLLARIDDGMSVSYYNTDPFGLEVVPEPGTLVLLAVSAAARAAA